MLLRLPSFIFILFTTLLSFSSLNTYAQQLSEQAKVSLLTAAPGNQIYSHFGHSALRIYDPINRIDKTYNYGVFDFRTDNFALKFMRGKLPYMLSASSFRRFKSQYQREGRTTYEQTLNLSLAQKQQLYELLKINLLPENRTYPYDFFFDNCSTRIRDILQKATNHQIQFPDTLQKPVPTFRDLLQPYTAKVSWLQLGINLILGQPTDQIASVSDQMFLPDYLMEATDQAFIATDSSRTAFVADKQQIIPARPAPLVSDFSFLTAPTTLLWFISLLLLLWTFRNPPRQTAKRSWFDFFLFGFMGWVGVLFFFMWVGTDHIATNQNWNMLWAFPLHVFFVWGSLTKHQPKWLAYYWLLTLGLLSIALLSILFHLLGIPLLPQVLPTAMTPVILVLWLRAYYLAGGGRSMLTTMPQK